MLNSLCKKPNINNQDNLPPPEPSNPIVLSPNKSNLAQAEEKDFKTSNYEYVQRPLKGI